jgi:hypothetical protein
MLQHPPTDDRATEREERFMHVGAALTANKSYFDLFFDAASIRIRWADAGRHSSDSSASAQAAVQRDDSASSRQPCEHGERLGVFSHASAEKF